MLATRHFLSKSLSKSWFCSLLLPKGLWCGSVRGPGAGHLFLVTMTGAWQRWLRRHGADFKVTIYYSRDAWRQEWLYRGGERTRQLATWCLQSGGRGRGILGLSSILLFILSKTSGIVMVPPKLRADLPSSVRLPVNTITDKPWSGSPRWQQVSQVDNENEPS